MSNRTVPETTAATPPEQWFDDACILDMDYFVKTISGIKAKGVRPDLIGSIIAHYSSKWLPDLSPAAVDRRSTSPSSSPEQSVTAAWMKKRFFVETLVGILPGENDAVPCNFLLRLLRVGTMVGVGPNHRAELERRAARQLEQADLRELLIPSFSHTCGTLLDVDLVTRLVKRFLLGFEEGGGGRSGAAVAKVARLVDNYLAEAAVDTNLGLGEFIDLAGALPPHARATDDGLYRAIDTYLKAHPSVTKQERKLLCRLIDIRKLSTEASLHASQNERLPVRAVLQVLFSEQSRLITRQLDWSGPFGFGSRSGHPSPATTGGLETRCLSKRETNMQHMEIKRLKDEVLRLQSQCMAMQAQMEKLSEKKKGFFKWKKVGIIPSSFRIHGDHVAGNDVVQEECRKRGDHCRMTPVDTRADGKVTRGRTHPSLRKSMS
ncbi:hypothetical protein V2J09_005437 [Rumex salicifolius]